MQETPDISKIVALIMQNPTLIEQISALAKSSSAAEDVAPRTEEEASVTSSVEDESTVRLSEPSSRSHRNELLCALKPYLSENRRAAVDSMMSISDILGMMRKR